MTELLPRSVIPMSKPICLLSNGSIHRLHQEVDSAAVIAQTVSGRGRDRRDDSTEALDVATISPSLIAMTDVV
jgi:hypothetical protein